MPLSRGLSRSIATIASSAILPIVGYFALFWRYVQRAAGGTQKMFSARYSSGVFGVGYGIFAFARDQLRMMFFEAVGHVTSRR